MDGARSEREKQMKIVQAQVHIKSESILST